MTEFDDMLHRAIPISEYLTGLSEDHKPKYTARRKSYHLNAKILKALQPYVDKFMVVVICADWCKDCVLHAPVLGLISEVTGLRVEMLGGVKTDPLNPNRQWAVPPSPPEVETLSITRIPTILIYTPDGQEVGRIIKHPAIKETLEEELLHIMSRKSA